jgi:hypothetical protein
VSNFLLLRINSQFDKDLFLVQIGSCEYPTIDNTNRRARMSQPQCVLVRYQMESPSYSWGPPPFRGEVTAVLCQKEKYRPICRAMARGISVASIYHAMTGIRDEGGIDLPRHDRHTG